MGPQTIKRVGIIEMKKQRQRHKLEDYKGDLEPKNRRCNLCGDFIPKGAFRHLCTHKKLKDIERGRKASETTHERYGEYPHGQSLDDRFANLEGMIGEDIDPDEEGFL